MATYKLKAFSKFARNTNLTRHKLLKIIIDAGNGLYTSLGGELCSNSVIGQGNRNIVKVAFAYKRSALNSFFLHGYLRASRFRLTPEKRKVARIIARKYINLSNAQVQQLINNGDIIRV